MPSAWQLDLGSAQAYQDVLVPAILGPFARSLVAAVGPRPGEAVLDLGCGTGAAARCAAGLVGPAGSVVGLDVNAAMLQVAESLPPARGAAIRWLESPAERIPVADASVDVVVCGQVLQFVRERRLVLQEIRRVARPGARIGIGVWCPLEENPYFAALVRALTAHLGGQSAEGLLAAFSLSDRAALLGVLCEGGLPPASLAVHELVLPLPALDRFVPAHLAATPLARAFAEAPTEAREAVARAMAGALSSHSSGTHRLVPFRSWLAIASV
jgi:SAM-dependent methyltransferase